MAVYINNTRPNTKPVLNFDFMGSRSVDQRIVTTRASQATYLDKNGVLQTVQNDTPRIEYDPQTGIPKGLVVEETRTNLIQNSTAMENNWTLDYGGYIIRKCTLAPDGTWSGNLLCSDGTSGSSRMYFNLASSGTYTCSFFVKKGASSVFSFWVYTSGWVYSCDFTWTGGVPVPNGAATVQAVGNGWFRIFCTYTGTSSGSCILSPAQYSNATSSSNTYYWGVQNEVSGGVPTSYIPSSEVFTSRSSSATYFDSNGTLRIAGPNQVRNGYAYDTATGTWISQGQILENSAATNIIYDASTSSDLYGNTLGTEAIYTKTNNSPDVTAPNGTPFTTKVVSGSTGNTWYWRIPSGGTFSTNTTYTISVWIRTAAGTTATWYLQPYPYSGSTLCNVTDTWQRFSVRFTTDGSGTQPYIGLVSPQINSTFYVWGWQAETGPVATSYISTYGASATRAADVYTTSASTRADEYNKITFSPVNRDFTLYAEYLSNGWSNPFPRIFVMPNSLVAIGQSNNLSYFQCSNSPYATAYSTAVTTGTYYRSLAAYSAQTGVMTMANAGSTSTVVNSTGTISTSYIYIGSSSGNGRHLNGYFRSVKMYSSVLAPIEMTTITT